MTELAIRQDTAPVVSAPDSLIAWARAAAAAEQLALPLCRTQFVPSDYQGNADAATAAILYGAEVGMSPLQALQGIYVYKGKPAMYARTMMAVTLAKGHEIWTEQSDPRTAVVCGRRRGSSFVERVEWTIARATTAGYVAQNKKYTTDPQGMLLARAQSDVCRRVAPDALLGMAYAVEELEDQEPAPTSVQQTNGAAPTKRTMRRAAAPVAMVPPEPSLDPGDPAVTDLDEPSESGLDDHGPAVPETGEAITREQMRKLQASFGDLDIKEREARLNYSSLVIGREIATSNDLTKREASAVIDALTTDINERNEQESGGAA